MARPRLSSKETKFQPSRESARILSLNGGQHAYLFDDKGKKHHLERNSEEFLTLCQEQNALLDGLIARDLERLGWDDVLAKL